MSDTRDSTEVTLRFIGVRGNAYIAIDDAIATLRALLPLSPASDSLIESIELEWQRAAEKALVR